MTKDERKEGLTFAEKVRQLAAEAPDGYARRDINRLVKQMQQRYGLSDSQKKGLILRTIEDGAATLREIEEETGIPSERIAVLMRELETEGKIRRHKGSYSGLGRPAYQFFAAYV